MEEQPQLRWLEGRYGLEAPIGRGGMGVVWLAKDALLGRHVAVKELRLPPEVPEAERPTLRARQLREARAASRINHPAATTVHDVIEDDGEAFIVMELVRAPTLDQLVHDDGPVDPAVAARIGLALLGALEAAHRAGIVHRDVKPSNVLITPEGDVKLTDFGIASLTGDPKLTTAGSVLGTPSYTAPEQARDGDGGVATDAWGLGATLYFAVEGVPPFDRGGTMPTLAAVLEDDPRRAVRAGPLAPVLDALLVKEPAHRPDLTEVRRLLQPIAHRPDDGDATDQRRGEPRQDDDPSLRRAVGRAAKELAPAVSALLDRHEALRGVRRVLGEADERDRHGATAGAAADATPRGHAPAPGGSSQPAAARQPAAAQRQQPETAGPPAAPGQTRRGLDRLVRGAWRVTKGVLIVIVVVTVGAIGYVVLQLLG